MQNNRVAVLDNAGYFHGLFFPFRKDNDLFFQRLFQPATGLYNLAHDHAATPRIAVD